MAEYVTDGRVQFVAGDQEFLLSDFRDILPGDLYIGLGGRVKRSTEEGDTSVAGSPRIILVELDADAPSAITLS